jgi:hypothetical protein
MENVATYSEARSEYTKQLATFIVPALVSWFQQLWARNSANTQQCLSLFQNECEEIVRWNQDRIHDEVRVLIERTGCDYMEELMTAVFIAHTKVLTAVRLSTKQKKLSITVPKLDHFIHRVFREAARSFWKTAFLFTEVKNVVERQKNILQIEALAAEAITSAVRSLLPVKQILHDYLDGDQEEIEDAAPPAEVEPKEEEVATPPPTPAPTPVQTPVPEPEQPPPVVNIDTEDASTGVRFSNYDAVFDETKQGPEMRYSPKAGEEDEDDDYNLPSDGVLQVNESSAAPVEAEDFEDLEAPPPPPAKEADDEMEVLE